MTSFGAFFQLGLEHLIDWAAYDHMVFLLALCAPFKPEHWRKLVWMVTAFTIGHSLTLALAVTDILHANETLIEVLIPVTIMLTALKNVLWKPRDSRKWLQWGTYLIVLFFGLIHGMGFSNFLKSMLLEGGELVQGLLAFNLGLEAGQLLVVVAIVLIMLLSVRVLKLPHRYWNYSLSAVAFGISIILILQKL